MPLKKGKNNEKTMIIAASAQQSMQTRSLCTDPDLVAALPGLQVSSPCIGEAVLSAPEPHLLLLLSSYSSAGSASVSIIPLANDDVTRVSPPTFEATDIDTGDNGNGCKEEFNVRIEISGAWAEIATSAASLFVNWEPVTEDRPAALQPGALIACGGCLYLFSWDRVLTRCQRALLGNLCLLKDRSDPSRLLREAENLACQVDRLSVAAERRGRLAVRLESALSDLEAVLTSSLADKRHLARPGPVAKPLQLLRTCFINWPGLRVGSAIYTPAAPRCFAAVSAVENSTADLDSVPQPAFNCLRITSTARTHLAVKCFGDKFDIDIEETPDCQGRKEQLSAVTRARIAMATKRQLSLLSSVGQQLADLLSKLNEQTAMEEVRLCQLMFDPLCDVASKLVDSDTLSYLSSPRNLSNDNCEL